MITPIVESAVIGTAILEAAVVAAAARGPVLPEVGTITPVVTVRAIRTVLSGRTIRPVLAEARTVVALVAVLPLLEAIGAGRTVGAIEAIVERSLRDAGRSLRLKLRSPPRS